MMATEGPFLAAVIARLPEPKYNLAAYGVAFAFAMLLESPIILIMSAATALVEGRDSFYKLRNFTYALNLAITSAMAVLLIPPLFMALARGLIGLPEPVALLTHRAALLLLPWPAAIGYRRFYQGILIRNRMTRRVAYGTVVRLSSMSGTAILLFKVFHVDGALLGAASLSAGVVMEAVASRLWALGPVRRLKAGGSGAADPPQAVHPGVLSYGEIWRFYYPLALTSILTLGINPMATFFLGRSRLALESLAVMPVVNALVFIFSSLGLAFQEVAIALVGVSWEGYRPLRRFAAVLGAASVASLAAVAATPALNLWLKGVSGLTDDLTAVAAPAVAILVIFPGINVLISFQRAMLVSRRQTNPITYATVLEVGTTALALFLGTRLAGVAGATAAAMAFVVGRGGSTLYLWPRLRGASPLHAGQGVRRP